MIFLYSDVLFRAGGIESYLHALALTLEREEIPFRVVVTELEPCALVDELVARGQSVYRQRRLPGDRWLVRQRAAMLWLRWQIKPGDWVFCVRQPMAGLYPGLIRLVHGRGAKLAASWALAPEFLPPTRDDFNESVARTDTVISVARCNVDQFRTVYGYDGPVRVVPYHNLPLFDGPLPLPAAPPWKIGYLGRLEIQQKNLDRLLVAFAALSREQPAVELHFHGRGPDQTALETLSADLGVQDRVFFHGAYDHRRDLRAILGGCHFLVYPSRFEGGPCFSLLEMMQAGRFCVAARVGGIPDLYEGHPEAGLLMDPADAGELTGVLAEALRRVQAGDIDPARIRERYFEGFDLASAHRAWMNALALTA